MKIVRCGLVAALALLAGIAGTQQSGWAQEARLDQPVAQRYVTVSAEGSVSARPDMARISSGVVSEADSAKEALSQNNAAMEKLLSGLKGAGIADQDIKTSGFNVSPRYKHNRDGGEPRITGYSVTNDVSVTVRDLAGLGPLLDRLVSLGANNIGGLSFAVAESDAHKDEARRRAIANARARAELYAAAAGARLGQVLIISEEALHVAPRPMVRAAMASDGVPLAEGSEEITARVTVTYALE